MIVVIIAHFLDFFANCSRHVTYMSHTCHTPHSQPSQKWGEMSYILSISHTPCKYMY